MRASRRRFLRAASVTVAGLAASAFGQAVPPATRRPSPALEERLKTLLDERDRDRAVDAATIGALSTIDDATERQFNLRESASRRVTVDERVGREASGWFSYDLPVDGSNAVAVVVTYNMCLPRMCRFTISADGERFADELVPAREEVRFFDVHYGVPAGVATGKTSLTIRFDAAAGSSVPPVFAVRTIRA